MADKSLLAQNDPLAASEEQRRVLAKMDRTASFDRALTSAGLFPLTAAGLTTLQINVGKLCNQTCRHCHVDAGPDRREQMARETAEHCVRVLSETDIATVDITGGAPELNPNFRWIVEESVKLGRHVIDRCNLTVLSVPSQTDLAQFLADHRVEIIASLPYFLAAQTDAQRGAGVFDRSLEALKKLNSLGYGQEGTGLRLNLVTNPVGAFLPAPQKSMEATFKKRLHDSHGIIFNNLYTITNMPISRFLQFLLATGNYETYMERLTTAFNPSAAAGVMCRTMISVGWDGTLYDCDFNQMLDLTVGFGAPAHIRDFHASRLSNRRIVTGNHCYGCAAGSGSSCGGTTA